MYHLSSSSWPQRYDPPPRRPPPIPKQGGGRGESLQALQSRSACTSRDVVNRHKHPAAAATRATTRRPNIESPGNHNTQFLGLVSPPRQFCACLRVLSFPLVSPQSHDPLRGSERRLCGFRSLSCGLSYPPLHEKSYEELLV